MAEAIGLTDLTKLQKILNLVESRIKQIGGNVP